MKKIALMIALLFVVAIGCKKEYCWKCKITVTYPSGNYYSTASADTTICGATEKEIRQVEENFYSFKYIGNGRSVKTSLKCQNN